MACSEFALLLILMGVEPFTYLETTSTTYWFGGHDRIVALLECKV
jgi:hypothetical protein